jgi:hypothetical protein
MIFNTDLFNVTFFIPFSHCLGEEVAQVTVGVGFSFLSTHWILGLKF